jgi:hypothetical protein
LTRAEAAIALSVAEFVEQQLSRLKSAIAMSRIDRGDAA